MMLLISRDGRHAADEGSNAITYLYGMCGASPNTVSFGFPRYKWVIMMVLMRSGVLRVPCIACFIPRSRVRAG